MSFSQLPVELLDAFCFYLSPADLASLCRTSSVLYPVAQRLLYREVSIDFIAQNLSVVVTLAKKPRIASYVRKLAIRLSPFSTLFSSFYSHLRTALSSMHELTSLDLFADASASWVLRTPEDTTYPRLTHFASSFAFDEHVVHFLQKAGALLDLEVDSLPSLDSRTLPSLSAVSLPRLTDFTGSSQAAQVIVPGRPVDTIHLNSGDMTEDVAESLAMSTAHVLVLGATTSSRPVPLLGSLAQRMPHLVYLRMMTTYEFADAPDAVFYENIANALTSLPDLKAFELSGMHWGSSQKELNDARVWQSEPLNTGFGADDAQFADASFAY
ncbi:hypothetical protein BDQ12DRAFT_709004 [Crucibulum laeve]|uniref:F-box domain-containing protein n=1 Tax=Crucibulum laeve TaxID=68775 RepID=A0A5C3MCU9_9AGAR|nr:hypothetical protein BDQ12DRAFT_709004 [Crucibulum laeve]